MASPADSSPRAEGPDEGRPPLFRTWNGMYALVIATLAVVVAAFAALTAAYR
jgi:hypothetical protein